MRTLPLRRHSSAPKNHRQRFWSFLGANRDSPFAPHFGPPAQTGRWPAKAHRGARHRPIAFVDLCRADGPAKPVVHSFILLAAQPLCSAPPEAPAVIIGASKRICGVDPAQPAVQPRHSPYRGCTACPGSHTGTAGHSTGPSTSIPCPNPPEVSPQAVQGQSKRYTRAGRPPPGRVTIVCQ